MQIAIIKYNAGNVCSVDYALRRLGVEPLITSDPEILQAADRVIFPGVGEAQTTMQYLRYTGLDSVIKNLRQPVLGICLGMQLLCRHSEEGDVDCLDIFHTDVKRFIPIQHTDKIPHMGWNTLQEMHSDLFAGLPQTAYVYFVHSYYVPTCAETIASSDYIHPFSSALQHNNFYATQFHPEKSGSIGEAILRNFLNLRT